MLLMATCHLPLAWWMLDRNRVGAASRFGAAIATTLAIVTSCVALDPFRLLLPVGLLMAEIGAVQALAWWHDRLFGDGDFEIVGG